MADDVTIAEATCIGCGCTDSRACPDGQMGVGEACEWAWVNREEGRGRCTSCNDGDWELDPEAQAAEIAEDNAR